MGLSISRKAQLLCKSPRGQLALLCLIVLLTRLPFLDAGYGVNFDAWRVVRAAREIANTGEYTVSRFPGYPIQEIVCSWIWRGGPLVLNGLTALLSVAAVATLVMIARRWTDINASLVGLGFAATPTFFVNSVCSKDYVWALAFALFSLLFILRRKPLLAGALLGLGTGCRLTTLALALPFALILAGETPGSARCNTLKFAFATVFTAIVAFSPVWLRYGTSFFTFYENHARPDWMTILSRGTIDVWGIIGVIGLLSATASLFWKRTKPALPNKFVVPAFLLVILIYVGAYLRLPDQAGYLLPIVPFALLLLQMFANKHIFQVFCLSLVVAPFADFSGNRLAQGQILADHRDRLETMARIRSFLAYSETLAGRNTFVVGGWEPEISVMIPEGVARRNRYVYLLDAEHLDAALKNGDHVFYLPLMREFNWRVYNLDLAQYGAIDLRAMFEQEHSTRTRPR
jgi:hypothetical protein